MKLTLQGALSPVSKTITVVTIALWIGTLATLTGFTIGRMATLARLRSGRILLHLLAMLGDGCVRFHFAGIVRELPSVAPALALLARIRTRLFGALALYLVQPIKHRPAIADPQSLAAMLDCGDVLLSDGNSRVAALIKRFTGSTWSHVSMYVGPLEEGPDPPCIVEADLVGGVRPIRLSELNASHVRVLRPVGLNNMHRRQLANWVVSRIGSEYDVAHAWVLGRSLLPLPLPRRWRSSASTTANTATRFICCSLLAHAFTLVGYPILPVQMRVSPAATIDQRNLTPGDFEHASLFQVVSLTATAPNEKGPDSGHSALT